MLTEPDSKWFDDISTPVKETATDIADRSFIATINELVKQKGKPGKSWEMGRL